MGSDWKYIMFELEHRTAVLFPPHVTHADMAQRFRPLKPLSAGFVRFDDRAGAFACYGESASLRLEAAADDAVFVNRLMPRD